MMNQDDLLSSFFNVVEDLILFNYGKKFNVTFSPTGVCRFCRN